MQHPPPGLFGGEPGSPGGVIVFADGVEQPLASKFPYRKARKGDRLDGFAQS